MRQLWTQAAVVALTAGTLGAYAGTADAAGQRFTPNFPITQPATPPAEQPVATQPATTTVAPGASETLPKPTPIPNASAPAVTQSALPPAPAARPAPTRTAYQTPAPTLRAAPSKTVVTTSVTGPVVEVKGKPQVHVVESGDALDAIARGMGSTRAELVEINKLKAPYHLKLGQKIKGPASEQKAYVVQQGDTMFSIAKRFNVTAAALAEENDLKAGSAIKKGQKLLLPDGFKDKGPIKTTQVIPGTPAAQVVETAPETTPAPTPTRQAPSRVSRQIPTAETAEPATVSTTTVRAGGPVITVDGPPEIHVVKSGETLTSIAKRFDVSVKDLADENDIKTTKALRPGQRIKGPPTDQKAYVAEAGDTLADVSKRFNVSVKALAATNGLRAGASLKKGQKIRLPSGYRDKGPIRTTTTVTRPSAEPSNTYAKVETPTTAPSTSRPIYPSTPSAPVPYTPSPSTSYPRPSAPVAAQPAMPSTTRPLIESSAAPTEAEIVASGKGKFAWPLRGELISNFGVKGAGQRNDGLNIRAAQGTPVLAAGDGEVAYAGNQVQTFGNLVLIKHADGWVTAYAHLSSINVKMRQQIKQGEQIGAVGQTGGVTEPQLHFEMRYAPSVKDKAKPVDPNLVLPR
jgi:murein DD-endopeptidase MepM/ murein hydrolase activator NlpD